MPTFDGFGRKSPLEARAEEAQLKANYSFLLFLSTFRTDEIILVAGSKIFCQKRIFVFIVAEKGALLRMMVAVINKDRPTTSPALKNLQKSFGLTGQKGDQLENYLTGGPCYEAN